MHDHDNDLESAAEHAAFHLRHAAYILRTIDDLREQSNEEGQQPMHPVLVSAMSHEAMAHSALAMGMLTHAQFVEAYEA